MADTLSFYFMLEAPGDLETPIIEVTPTPSQSNSDRISEMGSSHQPKCCLPTRTPSVAKIEQTRFQTHNTPGVWDCKLILQAQGWGAPAAQKAQVRVSEPHLGPSAGF